jgi:hypothetical protein
MNQSRSFGAIISKQLLCGSKLPTPTIGKVVPDNEDYETFVQAKCSFPEFSLLETRKLLYPMMVQFKVI